MTIGKAVGNSRLEAFFSALHALYVGSDTTWWFGAKYIFMHDNWDRIVMWPSQGSITAPTTGAQGFTTSSGGTDDKVFQRMPTVLMGLWAEDFEQAEHRLHSLLVALDDLQGQADIDLSNIVEAWPMNENQDLSTNGVQVVLSFNVALDVLARDTDITTYDTATTPIPPRPEPGDGGPTETVTSVDLNTPDETDVPTKNIT